jgi:Planctomycete cytochrome C/WD domain, G-beta repeat
MRLGMHPLRYAMSTLRAAAGSEQGNQTHGPHLRPGCLLLRWVWFGALVHLPTALFLFLFPALPSAGAADPIDFNASIAPLFQKHCLDCHAADDPEGKLVLENYATLMKGGASGQVLMKGQSETSLLIRMIEGRVEKDGKTLIMPPGKKREKLKAEEIALIRAWIDAGAAAPTTPDAPPVALAIPKIEPKVPPRRAIQALAYAPALNLIAAGRYREVELRSAEDHSTLQTLSGHQGNVNALVFSKDGRTLFAAAGEPVRFGEVRQWNVPDGQLIRVYHGHRDALYALALSPDGRILATGSYDQKIKLWNTETGAEIKTLSGHNGCVFDLAFRADGRILASASADRTVKLWDVATGERRDTLSQSLKEVYTLAFSPDGQRLLAGGVDNRIRLWRISDEARETTNPLIESRFAHEGAILKIRFASDGKSVASSADDGTVRIWNAGDLTERTLLERQPDWPLALAFAETNGTLVVGRADGSLQFYDAASGKVQPPPKPGLRRAEPRGIERGYSAKIKLVGSHLRGLTGLNLPQEKLAGALPPNGNSNPDEAWITLRPDSTLARGPYEISVSNEGGESERIKRSSSTTSRNGTKREMSQRLGF